MRSILMALMALKFVVCQESANDPGTMYRSTTPASWHVQMASKRHVKAGASAVLYCDVKHRHKTTWYGQKYNKHPFTAVSGSLRNNEAELVIRVHWGFKSRVNMTWNPANKSISLVINNINFFDQGFYYCTTGEDVNRIAGKGYVLTVDEEAQGPSTSSPLPSTEAVRLSGGKDECWSSWLTAAALCPLCIAITGLVCFFIHKKKCEEEELQHTDRGQDKEQSEDAVQYSTLRFSRDKPPDRKKH